MKKIIINQEKSEPLILLDDDLTEINSYTKELSKILELSKVCILETSYGCVILKPSKINSIFINEIEGSIKPNSVKNLFNNGDVIKD